MTYGRLLLYPPAARSFTGMLRVFFFSLCILGEPKTAKYKWDKKILCAKRFVYCRLRSWRHFLQPTFATCPTPARPCRSPLVYRRNLNILSSELPILNVTHTTFLGRATIIPSYPRQCRVNSKIQFVFSFQFPVGLSHSWQYKPLVRSTYSRSTQFWGQYLAGPGCCGLWVISLDFNRGTHKRAVLSRHSPLHCLYVSQVPRNGRSVQRRIQPSVFLVHVSFLFYLFVAMKCTASPRYLVRRNFTLWPRYMLIDAV